MILLKFITGTRERTLKYKTLEGAMRRARTLMGSHPRKDPDGYAVNRKGECLFIIEGATFEEVFPAPSKEAIARLLVATQDYDETAEEAKASLTAEGVDVLAFLDRVHSAVKAATEIPEDGTEEFIDVFE